MRGAVRPGMVTGVALAAAVAGCASGSGAQGGSGSAGDGAAGCYQIEWNADMARLGMPWGFDAAWTNAYAAVPFLAWLPNLLVAEWLIRRRGLPSYRLTPAA